MAKHMEIHFTVNGIRRVVRAEASKSLLRTLREDLGLIAAKEGCGQGDCGSCIVMMDGAAVNSCLILAPQAEGSEIITLEGVAHGDELHPLQKHFSEKWAFQCGYCTPGMLMSGYALLCKTLEPSLAEIKEAVEGNLCRCTSYKNIIESIQATAADLKARASSAGQAAGPSSISNDYRSDQTGEP